MKKFISHIPTKSLKTGLMALMIVLTAKPAFAEMATIAGAPDGFETMEKPRLTSVTVYYGGEAIGNFAAEYTPSTLEFKDADAVIAAIPTIDNKEKVRAVLSQPLANNAELVCGSKPAEGCGKLEPKVAGVIFDENTFTANLFFSKEYLAVVRADAVRYLPLPERKLSSTMALSGAVSGTDSQSPTFAVTSNSVYSFGEARINTQSTISNQGLRFDNANGSVDRNGWSASAGLFRSTASQLIADHDMAGVSVSTSTRTVMDNHKSEGNNIILYLPSRAFVSVYKEGRLYSSRQYEAGNQQIDTSELPDGAYTITLKIQETDGSTREEKRFFARTQQIPSPGQPVYYAEAGVIRKPASMDSTAPQITGDPILHAGTVQRIDDNIGLSASVMGLKDRVIGETGVFIISGGAQAQATIMASSEGDYGIQGSFIENFDKFSASIDARRIWAGDKPAANYSELNQDVKQASLNLSYQFTPKVTAGLRANYSQQNGSPNTVSAGPYAQWNIWQEGESMLSLNADAARTQGQNQGSVMFHFSKRLGGDYGVTGSAGALIGGDNAGPTGSAKIWHNDTTPGNSLLTGVTVASENNQRSLGADADWKNSYGQVQGSVQQSFGPDASLNYGGNFSLNAAQIGGDIHVGGSQNASSAIVIETEGDVKGKMKIYVNNSVQDDVTIGGQQTLYLMPFHTYSIHLEPEQKGLLDYENADKKVTLYPGNVVKLNWKINKFYVVAAKIILEDGAPLSDAILQESRVQATTDAKGRIQAELSNPDKLTFTLENGGSCLVTLPKIEETKNGVLVYKKPLTCTAIAKNFSQ